MELKLYNRVQYIERIRPFIGKPIIKILTGQRRIGKSYLLKLLIQELQKSTQNHIIYIDKEREEFSRIQNHQQLYTLIKEQLNETKENFLFIDEVQEIDGFQHCLRSLLNEQCCDIYCTGSNAYILSGDLATLLAGRYIEFPIYSLSYTEFIDFNQLTDSTETLQTYLTIGGMPYQHHLGTDTTIVFEYLKNVYASILLKDVVKREGIRNVALLENLVAFVADNVGNLFSAQNISKYLKSQRINMPTQTVLNYLKALTNAFVIHRASRVDLKGMKIFEVGEKYYFEDLGIRNSIAGINLANDISKLIENAIFMHLKRLGYVVFVGKENEQEIDFIAEKNKERIYIQACYLLTDEKVRQREFGNLLAIEDNFQKYVVSMDEIPSISTYKGIIHCRLNEFLLKNSLH